MLTDIEIAQKCNPEIITDIAKRLNAKRNAPPIGCTESQGHEIEIGIVGRLRQRRSAKIGCLEIHAGIEQEFHHFGIGILG